MENEKLVIGYLQIRKIIGILGIALPVILIVGNYFLGACSYIQMSISQYYYTPIGDVFIGILCAISIFLFSYKGYDNRDNWAGNFACIFGLAAAIFPTNMKDPVPPCNFSLEPYPFPDYFRHLHTGSAVVFFLILAYFSIFLFTKHVGIMTPQKVKRNKIYRTCGYVIILCLLLLLLIFLNDSIRLSLENYKPIFVLEAIILWAFGVSWLIKGEFMLADK